MPSLPPTDTASDTAQAAPPGVTRAAVGVMVMLGLFGMLNFGDKAVLGLATPEIQAELGLSNTEIGQIGSAFYLLFSLSALLVGLVGFRVSASWLLVGMAVVWSVAQLPIVLASAGFTALLLTRILLGAGEGPAIPIANHVAFTWFPPRLRPHASAVIVASGALGVIIGGPLLIAVIAVAGWRWAFGVLGVLGFVWAVLWLVFGGLGAHGSDQRPASPREYLPLLRSRTWLAAVAAGFPAQWTLGLALAWLPTYLERVAGYEKAVVGIAVGLPSIVALLLVPLVVVLSRRLADRGTSGPVRFAVLGLIVAVLPAIGMAGLSLGAPGFLPLVFVALAFGAGNAGFPLLYATLADLAQGSPDAARGTALAVFSAIATLGAVAAPFVTGRILDAAVNEAAGFDVAFRVTAVLAVLGGIALLLLRPEADRDRIVATSGGTTAGVAGG